MQNPNIGGLRARPALHRLGWMRSRIYRKDFTLAVESRLFLNFLALIIRSGISNKIRGNKKLETVGVASILREMSTPREVTESHHYRCVITEPTKIQKLVISAFELEFS